MAMLMIADSPDGDVYDSCLSDSPMKVCVMSKQLIRSKRPQWCYINPLSEAFLADVKTLSVMLDALKT